MCLGSLYVSDFLGYVYALLKGYDVELGSMVDSMAVLASNFPKNLYYARQELR